MTNKVALDKSNQLLETSLENASEIITKNYLCELERYDIIKPAEEDKDIDIAKVGRFYKLSKLVVNKEENFLNKLTTVVNVALATDSSITTIIKSDGVKIEYYLGIVAKNARMEQCKEKREAIYEAFSGAFGGNLIGSKLDELKDIDTLKNEILCGKHYSSISGISSLRNEDDRSLEGYVQGIENLVDSLKGQQYTIVMIADPVSALDMQIIKQGYAKLHTELSLFAKYSETINKADTLSLSQAKTEGFSEGIAEGIAMTQSRSESRGMHFGGGINAGFNLGGFFNIGANINTGVNTSTADTTGQTESKTRSHQTNTATTDTSGHSRTVGRSVQITYENRLVKTLLDKIDKNLERLDECESLGAFNCATYIIADEMQPLVAVASNYNALMRGQNSHVQAFHINTWTEETKAKDIGTYISHLVHPRFKMNDTSVTPASIISGNELAIQMGLPKKSIPGITVIPMNPFGRNVIEDSKNSITLGKIYHMGNCDGDRSQNVALDIESLSMHTFITGSTGSGKSNAIYRLLESLSTEKVKFLVVEPAKGEYKDVIGKRSDVVTYGTNPNIQNIQMLRINPFRFPKHIHILEHLDRLVEIFNVCWPMYAAMPAILKDAVERAYVCAGWDLEKSENKYDSALFPTFSDVVKQIRIVLDESDYSADNKGDYIGSLATRLKSLTNGINGLIFTPDDLTDEELFDQNVIIDLSRVGSTDTKSLIMGLLVLKLQEYRMEQRATYPNANDKLKHVTVLEEAHNLLRRTATEQSSESANLLGKSVEMLANSIAEMRTYGEGFVIADQSPGLLDMSVIRNTNTKIILRLPDFSDRELVGKAAGLTDNQLVELARLEKGVAAISQNDWLEPVLCKIDKYEQKDVVSKAKPQFLPRSYSTVDNDLLSKSLLDFIMNKEIYRKSDRIDIQKLKNDVLKSKIDTSIKCEFLDCISARREDAVRAVRTLTYDFLNAKNAIDKSRKCGTVEEWVHCVAENTTPELVGYSRQQINRVMALIIYEQTLRDASYNDLLGRFTEIFEKKGGVY